MVQLVANQGGGYSYVLDHRDVGLDEDIESSSCAVEIGPDGAPATDVRGILSLIKGPIVVPDGLGSSTEQEASHYFKSKEFVLLYFGAGWCPPCKRFSSHLSAFAAAHSSAVGAFLVSHDLAPADRDAFVRDKNFAHSVAFPQPNFGAINSVAGISALPTVVVVDVKTGKMVTNWGKAAVHHNPEHCLEEWRLGNHGITWSQLVCNIS